MSSGLSIQTDTLHRDMISLTDAIISRLDGQRELIRQFGNDQKANAQKVWGNPISHEDRVRMSIKRKKWEKDRYGKSRVLRKQVQRRMK